MALKTALKKGDGKISKVCSRPGCNVRFRAFKRSYKEKSYCSQYCNNKHWMEQFRPNRWKKIVKINVESPIHKA